MRGAAFFAAFVALLASREAAASPGFGETQRTFLLGPGTHVVHHQGDVCTGFPRKSCLCVSRDGDGPRGCYLAVSAPATSHVLGQRADGGYELVDLASNERTELGSDRAAAEAALRKAGEQGRMIEAVAPIPLEETPESRVANARQDAAMNLALGAPVWLVIAIAVAGLVADRMKGALPKALVILAALVTAPSAYALFAWLVLRRIG